MSSEPGVHPLHRLHPATLPIRLLNQARRLLVPGLIVLFLARDSRWELWIMAIFIPTTVYEIYRYISLRYMLTRDELIVREGVIFRNERHVPFVKIQNIDLVQGPLQRLLGVAEVRVETGSGAKPEAVLTVLSVRAVDQMRARIFAERGEATVPEEMGAEARPAAPSLARLGASGEVLLQLSVGELVRLGLISNRAVPLVAVLCGLAWEFDLFEKIDWEQQVGGLSKVAGPGTLVAATVGAAAAVIIALVGASVLWTVIRFHGFTLRRDGDDLRLSCGLLTRRSATIPRHRVQSVIVRATPLHRFFDRVSIRVETAGGSEQDHQEGDGRLISRRWFAPLLRPEEVDRILDNVDPALVPPGEPWQRLPPRASRRMIRKGIMVAVLAALASLLFVRPWGPLCLVVLVPLAIVHGRFKARSIGYLRTGAGIFFRSGVLTRKLSAALAEKVQVVSLVQSPFDRRYHMASVRVDTAGAGQAGHAIAIPYLDLDEAGTLRDRIFHQAEASQFRW